MKRIICLITALCLVLGSFSFCFASPTSWDTSDQANLQYIRNSLTNSTGTVVSALNTIITNTNTIANHLNTIKGYLFSNDHGIAYWTYSITTWMSPIYNAIQQMPVDLFTIIGALGYYDNNDTYHPYLAEYSTDLHGLFLSLTNPYQDSSFPNLTALKQNAHRNFVGLDGNYNVYFLGADGTQTMSTYNWNLGTPIGNTALLLNKHMQNMTNLGLGLIANNKSTQTVINWGNLGNSSFTPTSTTDGIYKYLNSIQAPVARLAYVLANDQEIEARDSAAANQQAVVDNFIDSSGSGSASPSDIGSISDLSSGYQNNFGSDASVSGIFNIFNSNNMGWFSQETANQLDTTSQSRRGSSFETPLLDQQIEDIYDQIGVRHD